MSDIITADDTIVAIASPLAPARRGIVRMSGEQVLEILEKRSLFDPNDRPQSTRRIETTLDLGSPLGKVDVSVLVWPTRRSYTGQPSAELHVIGSLPLLDAVVANLIEAGARPARPGEFTMRAFLAGRLDLTQAEAVLGVIDAEDASTLERALGQLAGNLSRPLQHARDTLLNMLADVEAGLDFVDEDIEFIEDNTLIERLGDLQTELEQAAAQLRERNSQHTSLNVVLRGLPNAGKSCLLNRLSQSETAIVADEAGTTRDLITVEVEYEGHTFSLTDTAGLEHRGQDEPDWQVMSQAQLQANCAVQHADVCLWCIDASDLSPETGSSFTPPSSGDRKRTATDRVVLTKADLLKSLPTGLDSLSSASDSLATEFRSMPSIAVSSVSGEGIDELWKVLISIAQQHDSNETGGVMGTAARCRDSLRQSIDHLGTAIDATENQIGHEIVAAEMRLAVNQLGEVTGEVYTDDILDRVFSRFCIGK
ncbi:tRNA modification GTPase [Neorhodopirellula lusitana]|uniref:tRNA modification GTPase n=1 Tax=Neorhodopirellula lusitana TaxID=445327 RepID=UPI00384BB733